jgi:hypothetical protein
MFKKLPLKNILIVSTAMLVVPVMAFAMTMTANPGDESNDKNSNIKITSDENTPDAASAATSLLTSGALGYLDAATSATGQMQTGQSSSADAISTATSNPGTTGSSGYDDDEYEDDEDEDEEYDD